MKASFRRQRGGVAVLMGVSMVVLIGTMALVFDLGRDYIGKTELQNAADAAALAGAKELNGTLVGVAAARDAAIAVAGANKFHFAGQTVVIDQSHLWVGSCPQDSCMVPLGDVDTVPEAAGKSFMKVDTGQRDFATLLAPVMGQTNMQTFGMAVAGRYTVEIAPIGVCAIKPLIRTGRRAFDELEEFGFRRGVAYNLFELNPLGGSAASDFIWLNPIDMAPTECNPSNSNGTVLSGFLCNGTSALSFSTFPTLAYRNSGLGAQKSELGLNSRFDDFFGGNACDPSSAPPDRNIKEYSPPQNWIPPVTPPAVARQSIYIDPDSKKPPENPTFAQYGILWSYSRAVRATSDEPPKAGQTFPLDRWTDLYDAPSVPSLYPSDTTEFSPQQPVGSAYATPYSQTSVPYFKAPIRPGRPNRRVLNIAIVDCTAGLGPSACDPLRVVGVGKFFMQVPADLTGSGCSPGTPSAKKCLHAEFGGLLDRIPTAEIKLYR